MTKPYKPSDKIIEQIAKENWKILRPEQEWENNEVQQVFLAVAMESASCPTIRKALELYENQPQWQDKPDKEGWWWYVRDDSKSLNIYYLTASASGELKTERIPLATDLRVKAYPGKWLYMPEPEPYKGEE